ncbi:MAG: type II toxin-antitoxin system YafQ family toxin [Defluviitaleaceae bacterium]|nr:type II toxin-antitoxin system YafQ family toxin [Defluviitaleaceae bacterium]
MYKIQPTAKYKKAYKALKKRGYNMSLLKEVVDKLANGESLPAQHRDHPLKGNRKGYRDCHIQNDWILIYKIDKGVLTLVLSETGTHSDLF